MSVLRHDRMEIQSESDIVRVRQAVRSWSQQLGFSLVEQTKIVTAASEMARNALDHGGGGEVRLESLNNGSRRGLKLVFEDQGPGIANIEQAMKDGYSTRNGLGLGLGGARRLTSEFEIESTPGLGTRVTLIQWRNSFQ